MSALGQRANAAYLHVLPVWRLHICRGLGKHDFVGPLAGLHGPTSWLFASKAGPWKAC